MTTGSLSLVSRSCRFLPFPFLSADVPQSSTLLSFCPLVFNNSRDIKGMRSSSSRRGVQEALLFVHLVEGFFFLEGRTHASQVYVNLDSHLYWAVTAVSPSPPLPRERSRRGRGKKRDLSRLHKKCFFIGSPSSSIVTCRVSLGNNLSGVHTPAHPRVHKQQSHQQCQSVSFFSKKVE